MGIFHQIVAGNLTGVVNPGHVRAKCARHVDRMKPKTIEKKTAQRLPVEKDADDLAIVVDIARLSYERTGNVDGRELSRWAVEQVAAATRRVTADQLRRIVDPEGPRVLVCRERYIHRAKVAAIINETAEAARSIAKISDDLFTIIDAESFG